jgi:prevent-host-death family protein
MKYVDVHEAAAQLSALIDEAAAGEEIIITKNGEPRARLVALGPKSEDFASGVAAGPPDVP